VLAHREAVRGMRLSVGKDGRVVEIELRQPASPDLQGLLQLPFDLFVKLEAVMQKKAMEKKFRIPLPGPSQSEAAPALVREVRREIPRASRAS
jgi:hypothetical protein